MEKIGLSDNHKRAIFSAMFLIEKLTIELENELLHYHQKIMSTITDLDETVDLQHYATIIEEIKTKVRYMADKYNLKPTSYDLGQIINSRKSKMWEILCDTKSSKLKSRGEFPPEYALEFDADIENLLKLTELI